MKINQRRIFKSSGLVTKPDPQTESSRLPVLSSNGDKDFGKPVMVPIVAISESPYQTTNLNEVKVNELAKNLKVNPLTTPIILRYSDIGGGGPQLVAGRHRLEAYKRLGRTEIEATFREMSDDMAERVVFYDNLFAPSLADYEKYLGFARRKVSKGLTNEQLAEEAGVSKTLVTTLLAFDGAPTEVHEVLRVYPSAIGSTIASEFVRLAKIAPALAKEAIERISIGKLTQKAAIKWLADGGDVEKKISPSPIRKTIKSGRNKFVELTLRSNVLSMNCKDVELAEALFVEFEEFLKQKAANV